MSKQIESDKSRQAEHWNQEAQGYDRWYEKERGRAFIEAEARAVLQALELAAHHTVLELGCGTGRFTERMVPRVASITACDLSAESIEVLKSKTLVGRIETHCLDATKTLPFATASFDRLLAVQMIQHVDASLHRTVLREMRRVLRPGGVAVLTAYRFGRWIRKEKIQYASGLYRYAFEPQELRDLFTHAGFSPPKIRGVINLPGRAFAAAKHLAFLNPPTVALDLLLGSSRRSEDWGVYLLAKSTAKE